MSVRLEFGLAASLQCLEKSPAESEFQVEIRKLIQDVTLSDQFEALYQEGDEERDTTFGYAFFAQSKGLISLFLNLIRNLRHLMS